MTASRWMTARAYYNEEERCWYVPVSAGLEDGSELRKGIEGVRVQIVDRQLWIARPVAIKAQVDGKELVLHPDNVAFVYASGSAA